MKRLNLTYTVDGGDLLRAGESSSSLKVVLKSLGMPQDLIRRVSICMYEGEINMVIHADGGQIDVSVGAKELNIRMADRGPGIPDVEKAMTPGFSTATESAQLLGFGAGMGLPNMKKHSDRLEVTTSPGVGTTVLLSFRL